jgi:hypothetical protein
MTALRSSDRPPLTANQFLSMDTSAFGAQDGPAAQVFRRHDAGWLSIEVLGGDAVLRLESLGVEVRMADFYAGLPSS